MLSDKAIKKIKQVQALVAEEGYELFSFAYSDAGTGELATFAREGMSREELADVAAAVSNCLRDPGTEELSGACAPSRAVN